jgi:hypothetical protein
MQMYAPPAWIMPKTLMDSTFVGEGRANPAQGAQRRSQGERSESLMSGTQ